MPARNGPISPKIGDQFCGFVGGNVLVNLRFCVRSVFYCLDICFAFQRWCAGKSKILGYSSMVFEGEIQYKKRQLRYFSTKCHQTVPNPSHPMTWKNDVQWHVLNWKESSFLCVLRTWLSTAQRPWVFVAESREKQLHPPFTPPFLQHFLQKILMTPSTVLFFSNKPWTNQLWSMLGQDYSTCIIGVPDRRYLWIMGPHSIHRREQVASSHRKESKSRLRFWAERNGRYWWSIFSETLNCFWYLCGKKRDN